jgi:Zn-dependent peptidase ImmA (M78 family)/O-acetyl-ADP-ribose deacetylase (regulator of RNase III)
MQYRICEASAPQEAFMPTLETGRQIWTHPSVVALADDKDAVEAILSRARHMALSAIDSGWKGPPYDPFRLAEHLGIEVIPRDDIRDARVVPSPTSSTFQIEYNPNRPSQRVRFSLAHEIAHTLFPDCAESIRNRTARHELAGDDWQLEMLCNIAASELLMPVSSLPTLPDELPSIDRLMELRKMFDVSTEAILLRYARSTRQPCFVFAASRAENTDRPGRYRIDYAVAAASWLTGVRSGLELPEATIVRQCTAVDYTTKGEEEWSGCNESFHIEAVGVPPLPRRSLPRVVGIGSPLSNQPKERDLLTYVKGDATEPHGQGAKIIVHIVNDAARTWGGKFARAISAKWPDVAADYTRWVQSENDHLALGNCHVAIARSDVTVVSMVAQHGYGKSANPRIRYAALETCLAKVVSIAIDSKSTSTVHMAKIGTGQAGGSWGLIEEIIRDTLVQHHVPVLVYELPEKGKAATKGPGLFG